MKLTFINGNIETLDLFAALKAEGVEIERGGYNPSSNSISFIIEGNIYPLPMRVNKEQVSHLLTQVKQKRDKVEEVEFDI